MTCVRRLLRSCTLRPLGRGTVPPWSRVEPASAQQSENAPNSKLRLASPRHGARPDTVLRAFDRGMNFFFVTADMHWPYYEGMRQGQRRARRRAGIALLLGHKTESHSA